MKKILLALFLVALVPNVAMAATDANGFWKLDDPVLSQFDGIVINGQTASEVQSATRKSTWQKYYAESEAALADSNAAVEKFNSLIREDKALRHITEQTSGTYYTDPYDFMVVGSRVLHWLTEDWKILTCEHYSKAEVQYHAKIFNAACVAWDEYQEKNRKFTKIDTLDYVNNMFRSAVSKAMEPFYEQKAANMANEIAQRNSKIKSITCKNYEIEVLRPGIMGFCRQKNICRLAAIKNKNDILEISCACGHPLEQHEIKYKK